MSYLIKPLESYKAVRNCPKCGLKSNYINTHNFRINANGSLLDVWLIYQCEKCKSTLNIAIYERVKASLINSEEYRKFLSNDEELSLEYGMNKSVFSKNRVEINLEALEYSIINIEEDNINENSIIIENPYEMKIRSHKIIAEILNISRSKVNKLIKDKVIILDKKYIGKRDEIIFTMPISHIIDYKY
ncbi:MAG: DUF1062 domain-containing protein [Clostridiales bacterium]|nr:DUF1062 domain-containing protein [Clostridiales bacterium]